MIYVFRFEGNSDSISKVSYLGFPEPILDIYNKNLQFM